MAVAFDAVSNVAAGTGDLSWTHTPVGTPRGVKVDIVENGGTNGVSSVTYGGVAMELAAVNAKTSGEAGTVVTYFLGRGIPTGAQTVSVSVSDAVSKRAVATTVTAAADTCWISADISIGSDSIVNPSSTLNLLGKTCFVSLAGHSGQGAVTGTTPTTGWTSRLEHDFGAQVACWYTYNTVSTANVACGWTQTADDAVMVALAITEAPIATDTHTIGLTESASVAVVFDSRALPIILIESASVTILTSVSATDSIAVQAGETAGFNSQAVTVLDSLDVQSSEVSVVSSSLAAIETLAVQSSESASKDASTPTSQQALPIGLTDSASITQVAFFPTDTLLVGSTDTAALDSTAAVLSVADTLALGLSDARPGITAQDGELVLNVTDGCAVQCIDTVSDLFVFIPGTVQNFVVTDSLKVQLNGELAPPTQKTTADTLAVTLDEPSTQDGQFGVSDSISAGMTDQAAAIFAISANFAVSDSLSAQLTESSQVVAVTILTVADSARIQVPEDVPEAVTAISTTDTIRVVASEPSDQFSQFGVLDSLAVQANSEVLQIGGLLTFSVSDSLMAGISEIASFGVSTVGATDSCKVVMGEVLTNSSSVSAVDSLRSALTEGTTLFKNIATAESLTVQLNELAAPIFDNFVDITASDSCAVLGSEAVTELVSFLQQLTTTDTTAVDVSETLAEQFIQAVSSDQTAVSINGLVDIWQASTATDSLRAWTIEQGLAIPIVSVNVSAFAEDTIFGEIDGNATVSVVYEAIEQTVSDSCSVNVDDVHRLQVGQYADDELLVAVGEMASDTAVANASPETWNGHTGTEHRNDKPKPWKYLFTEKLNW